MTDCMCRGCYAGPGASLHYIPKDPEIRQKWIDFIYKNRTAPKLKNLDRIRICSAHFTEDCFTNYRQKMMGFGKRLILKPNAVPTVAVQLEITAPSRTRREKVEETTAETRLCPLCQRRQKDIEALSLHLIKKHSVHPACLDNLLITAPYAGHSTDAATQSSAHSINGTSQRTSSENTKYSLLPAQQDSSSLGNDARDELGVGNRGSSGDTEAWVNDEKSNAKSNGAADGNIKCPFKCHACLEFFNQKSACSVPCNSATIFQKIGAGTGNDGDSSTSILTPPYVSSKPYQCDVCHVSYLYAFGLESHRKSVLHQSRTRKAENIASNSKTNTEARITLANLPGTTVANATQLTFAKACNCKTHSEKVQLQPAASLLSSPGASTQSIPSVVPLLTLCPNSVPHAIIPPVFPTPGTSTAQLMPQTQMLMPLIVNGLHTQSPSADGPQQVLQHAVPVLHLCSAQHPQAPCTSDAQSQSGDSSTCTKPLERNTAVGGVGVKLKTEIKEEPCDEPCEVTPCAADAISQLGSKEDCNSAGDEIKNNNKTCDDKQKSKAKGVSVGGNSKRQHSDVKKASSSKDIQSSDVTKCSLTKCNSSHAKLVLMPSNTNPCSSLSCGPPVLTEFQSQVLWAFFESRNEADSEIPPREDCEALGRVVGLTEDEVQKWLVDTHHNKYKHHANVQSPYKRQGSTEDDEDTLVIDESGGMVLRSATDFLSEEEDADNEQTTVDKKRKKGKDEDDSEELGATKCRFLPSYRTS